MGQLEKDVYLEPVQCLYKIKHLPHMTGVLAFSYDLWYMTILLINDFPVGCQFIQRIILTIDTYVAHTRCFYRR